MLLFDNITLNGFPSETQLYTWEWQWILYFKSNQVNLSTLEPWYNKEPRDRENEFILTGVPCIGVFFPYILVLLGWWILYVVPGSALYRGSLFIYYYYFLLFLFFYWCTTVTNITIQHLIKTLLQSIQYFEITYSTVPYRIALTLVKIIIGYITMIYLQCLHYLLYVQGCLSLFVYLNYKYYKGKKRGFVISRFNCN